jgi:hypothetical protein
MTDFANNQALLEKDNPRSPKRADTGREEPMADVIRFSNQHLMVPGILRVPSPDGFSEIAVYHGGIHSEERAGRGLSTILHNGSPPLAPRRGVKGWLQSFWARNKGLLLVLLSQFFGTLMNVTTRLLEVEGNNGKGMHPFQVYP